MPKLKFIEGEEHRYYEFSTLKWFPEATNHRGLAKGGIYLLSGPPGCGKTTLALQMMVDFAFRGEKVLYVTLEQSPSFLKATILDRIFPYRRSIFSSIKKKEKRNDWRKQLENIGKTLSEEEAMKHIEKRIEENMFIDSSVNSMDNLPDFLIRQVMSSGAQYKDIKIMVVDSLQGLGTAPTSSRPYRSLYEFNRYAKDEGITCLLIGHVTKSEKIAGPRSLEHNVDCVLYMRRAMKLRPLFVPKNRYGPERHEPFCLIMNKWGCLEKSKHMSARASVAYGYLPGTNRLTEVQTLVKLPKFGVRPGILAPYLPRQKLRQIIGVISSIKDVDVSDLTFEINCYLPGGSFYSHILDFPLAMSILSSYFQLPLPPYSVFIGELDLSRKVRPISDESFFQNFLNSLTEVNTFLQIKNIFISSFQVELLKHFLSQKNLNIKVIGVADLEELIYEIWPEIGSL